MDRNTNGMTNGSVNKAVLALDIGGSKIMAGIVDEKGNVSQRILEALELPYTENDLLKTVTRMSRRAIDNCSGIEILCIGAAIPGLADAEKGIWEYSSFSGIRDFPFAARLSKELGLAVYIENDVNACAEGEMMFGACTDVRNFLWVTISNGIGGSVAINGKVYTGEYNNAGEIGHICADENGPQCKCGNRGCAEACAAGPGILRRYLDQIGELENSAALDAEIIADKARQGEPAACKVYNDTGYYLGKVIAAAVNILNPEKVILGGGVSASMDLFYPEMKKTLDRMVFRSANQNLCIEKTALGYDAALFGAAAIGFKGYKLTY